MQPGRVCHISAYINYIYIYIFMHCTILCIWYDINILPHSWGSAGNYVLRRLECSGPSLLAPYTVRHPHHSMDLTCYASGDSSHALPMLDNYPIQWWPWRQRIHVPIPPWRHGNPWRHGQSVGCSKGSRNLRVHLFCHYSKYMKV